MVRYRPDQTSGWREYPEINVVRATDPASEGVAGFMEKV